MPVMSTFDETQHPRSHDGTFTEKTLSAPEATLDFAVADVVALTPEEVRTPLYSKLALGLLMQQEVTEVEERPDGSMVLAYARYHDEPQLDGVVLDSGGDVIAIHETVNRFSVAREGDAPRTFERGVLDEEAQRLQGIIDRARLGAAGVALEDHPDNDGGHYGHRQMGAKAKGLYNATEISKLIREDIKTAKKFGALPEDLDVRVTTDKFAGGQAINVRITNLTDDIAQVPSPRDEGYTVASPLAKRLSSNIESIGRQYNDSENDSSIDYFDNKFYFHVRIDDDHSREWYAREKARKAAKR